MSTSIRWWTRSDEGVFHCEECGYMSSLSHAMLDHLVGHREDDGLKVPATVLQGFGNFVSYDEECARLARHFLGDVPGAQPWHETLLASTIQDAVESWLAENPIVSPLKG